MNNPCPEFSGLILKHPTIIIRQTTEDKIKQQEKIEEEKRKRLEIIPLGSRETICVRYYTNTQLCAQKDCFGGFPLLEFIGAGAFGKVMKTCIDGNCDYVIKLIGIKTNEDIKGFLEEIKFTKIGMNINIGPKIFDFGYCDNLIPAAPSHKIAWMVLEKYTITLKNYILIMEFKEDSKVFKNIIKQMGINLKKMKNEGFVNLDLHFNNIMLKLDKNNQFEKLVFIDYGTVQKTHLDQSVYNVIERWIYDFRTIAFLKQEDFIQ